MRIESEVAWRAMRCLTTFRGDFVVLLFLPAACSSPAGVSADAGVAVTAAPYSLNVLDRARIGSDSSMTDFQHAEAPIDLTPGQFAHVTLVVDLESPCFPWTHWSDDPPPAGQNWPADCDAFDRNLEMSLVDPAAPQDAPGLELVRAITPFGGPLHIVQDVTDAFNGIRGPRVFRINLAAYPDPAGLISGSRGSWYVSARLDVTPGAPPANVIGVVALYYDSITAGQTVSDVAFALPAGTTSSRIEYRVTGHGGVMAPAPPCYGPADEFCRRVHHVFVDDQEIAQTIPWRHDCFQLCTLADGGPFGQGRYCAENPCGDPTSVRAPRANWCPGSVTPPLVWTPPALLDGPHTFRFSIDGIAAGAQWRVSAVAYAYGD